MQITDDEIRTEIGEYKDKIVKARRRVVTLSNGSLEPKKHKQRVKEIKGIRDDIKHWQTIITIAESALDESLWLGIPE